MSALLLATPAEIWEIAFPQSGNTPDENINETLIETAQIRYLKPVLGPLYDSLDEARYQDFIGRSLGLMSASVGSLGILEGKTDYASPVSIRQLHALRKEARHQADILLDLAVEYIENNPSQFPEYVPQKNIRHYTRIRGGIVMNTPPKP